MNDFLRREEEVNYAIAGLLRRMRVRWIVDSQPAGSAGGKSPDILIRENGASSIIIEHEIMPANTVEQDALRRLGFLYPNHEVTTVIALRSPESLRVSNRDTPLEEQLRSVDTFEYALYRGKIPAAAERWPASGWLRGSLADLALLAQQAMRPSEEIAEMAKALQTQIEKAANVFTLAYQEGRADVAELMSSVLKLEDGPQTRRMAMAIIANALIFQQNLAPHYDDVRTPSTLYINNRLHQNEVLDDWRAILKRNYFPIFYLASEFMAWIDRPEIAEGILLSFFHEGQEVRRRNMERSHDLAGFIFQRLIADRKLLAAFYTLPESAALLAALAIPRSKDWEDADRLRRMRIADFACGTGTLLSAVYQRIATLHELEGGDAQAIHKTMLEEVLVGCDVLPMATHLTLSMLAAAYPEQTFEKTNIITADYGKQDRKKGSLVDYRLGSLDLLELQNVTSTTPIGLRMWDELTIGGMAIGGHGEHIATIPHWDYDLVIMNPPFTRPTGEHGEVGNRVFAAFGMSREDQKKMSQHLKKLGKGTIYNGSAGIASAFIALADKKLKPGGVLALVLPLIVLTGNHWEKTRQMLRHHYTDITVVTIAGAKAKDTRFSSDTNISECLIIAHKRSHRQTDRQTATSKQATRITRVFLPFINAHATNLMRKKLPALKEQSLSLAA